MKLDLLFCICIRDCVLCGEGVESEMHAVRA